MATKNVLAVKGTYTKDQLDLIKKTVARDATDDELNLFLYTCRHTGLDPLLRQIYAIKRNDGASGDKRMTIQTGIDGYRLIADRSGKYAGSDDPVFTYKDQGVQPLTATVTVYKIVAWQRCAFTATARWSEYAATGKSAFMWNNKGHIMLSKCAEALALRKAFPAELGPVRVEEEMAQVEIDALEPEMPRRASDATKEAPKAVQENPAKPEGQDKAEQAPTPEGYINIEALEAGKCKGCQAAYKKGDKMIFSQTKGVRHFDCC